MNNISFQGRSILELNTSKHKKILQTLQRDYRDLQNNNKRSLTKWINYSTTVDPENIAVVVCSKDTGFFRMIKTLNDKKIFEEISQKTQDLIDKSKNTITAWIIGGDKMNGKNANNTIETINKLADILCEKPNIDTSILAGIKKPQENIVIHNNESVLKITLEKPKNTDLEDAFDIVELNNTNII